VERGRPRGGRERPALKTAARERRSAVPRG
jgi:hypothetical protein